MPSRFGAPAKAAITEEDNKIKIELLSYDPQGKLTDSVSNTLKQNIANYLSHYRMINDYIQVTTANVIDLTFDISVVIDSTQNQGEVITNVIDGVNDYFTPQKQQLGTNVNISDIRRIIQNMPGVISLADLKVFNNVGGRYSNSQTSQRYVNSETKEIQLIDDTIYAEPNQVYQIRFIESDVVVRVKTLSNTDFS